MLVDAYTLLSMEKSTGMLLSQPAAVTLTWLISKNCGHVSSDCPEASPTISAQSAAHSDARRPAHPKPPPPRRIASPRARARAAPASKLPLAKRSASTGSTEPVW
jgi:hypothetical protein